MEEKLILKSLKSISSGPDEKGHFTAVVSTENIDRVNDIVLSEGIKASFPLPLLHEHNKNRQIGLITNGYAQDSQYIIEGYVDLKEEIKSKVSIAERYTLRKLAQDNAIQLSICYPTPSKNNLEFKNINNKQVRILKEVELRESSFVGIPANTKTRFLEMKTEDELYNQGLKELGEFYDKKNQEEKKIKSEIKQKYLDIINTTTSREEFENALKKYNSFNYGLNNGNSIKFVIDKTREFYKRANQKYTQKEEVKSVVEIEKPKTGYEYILRNLKN